MRSLQKTFLLVAVLLPSSFLAACSGGGLTAPSFYVNETGTGLSWKNVKGADHYEISVNDGDPYEASSYSFTNATGHYKVRIRSVAKSGKTSEYSDPYTYTTKATHMGSVDADGSILYYSVDTVANYVTVSRNDGEEIILEGTDYEAGTAGIYVFRAYGGYDAEDYTFYVNGSHTEEYYAYIPTASENYVIDEGAGEGYSLSSDNASVTSSEDAKTAPSSTEFVFREDGSSCTFRKEIRPEYSYQTLEFFLKSGQEKTRCSIGFHLDPSDLYGHDFSQYASDVSLSYSLGETSTEWTKYSLLLTDGGWKLSVDGSTYGLSTVNAMLRLAGYDYTLNSFADLLPAFQSLDVTVQSTNTTGNDAFLLLDDVYLGA